MWRRGSEIQFYGNQFMILICYLNLNLYPDSNLTEVMHHFLSAFLINSYQQSEVA